MGAVAARADQRNGADHGPRELALGKRANTERQTARRIADSGRSPDSSSGYRRCHRRRTLTGAPHPHHAHRGRYRHAPAMTTGETSMQRTDPSRTSSPMSGAKNVCCTDAPCDTGLRNHYFEGKRLTADSFRVEQKYQLERRRLLNRAIHGWGVVYGYPLKPAPADECRGKEMWGRLEIGPGLALDECGRELVQTRTILISLEDVTLLDAKGTPLEDPPNRTYDALRTAGKHATHTRACWLLSAHYAEQAVGPQKVNDPCSCERVEWEHVCETVRFSLRLVDCESCCAGFDCELMCGCGTGPCCEEQSAKGPAAKTQEQSRDSWAQRDEDHRSTGERRAPKNPVRRGGCQCLCEHAMGLSDVECCGLREISDPCVKIRADLHHGVPLACVRLREGDCDTLLFDRWIDACGPRRLVKPNDTLFDLIRGCDLTRISAIGWGDWHRSADPIGWDAFRDSFGAETPPDSGLNLTAKYWVEFS